jgi:hypothetical protein
VGGKIKKGERVVDTAGLAINAAYGEGGGHDDSGEGELKGKVKAKTQ